MQKKTVRLAIVGGGAIAEESYVPASAEIENVQLTHIIDLDVTRAGEVARRYNIPHYTDDYRDVFDKVDAVVVATPPSSHKDIAIECLKNGLHVLCEKPLANSVEEAESMVAAAMKFKQILAVGMVRRLNWSAETMKRLVRSKILGTVRSFEVIEGWEFNWPLRTNHIFQSKNSRGVISDTGAHMLDLIVWLLDLENPRIDKCSDDNWGGTEANARIHLSGEDAQKNTVSGILELSFTRRLVNTVKITGDNGSIEAPTVGGGQINYYTSDSPEIPLIIKPEEDIQKVKNDEFVGQLAAFTDSILSGKEMYVKGESVLKSMALIDACYRKRKPNMRPWEKLHVESYFEDRING